MKKAPFENQRSQALFSAPGSTFPTSRHVGIDVSKDKLDVAMLGDKQAWQVENAKEGIQKLVHQMQKVCPELIVVEATGGYQQAVVDALFHTGLAVAVVNPARVRQFARASGWLAKTNKLDAFVLAEFGRTMQLLPLAMIWRV